MAECKHMGRKVSGLQKTFTDRFWNLQSGRSNTEFADFLGLSRQTVGFYANGERLPDVTTLKQIAQECNVTTDYLLGLTDSQSVQRDIRVTQETLGISEKSVKNLSKVAREKRYPSMKLNTQRLGAALDLLLSSVALKEIAQSLYHLLDASKEMRRIEQWTVEDLREQDLDYAEKKIEDAFSDYRLARLDLTESIQSLMNGDTEHFVSAQDASGICERAYARCGEASALNAQETERAAEAHEAASLQQLKEVEELGFCTFEND